MSKEFSAQYMTTFLEHDLELSCDLVARKFGENASLHERKFLDSNIRIVDGKYLEVNRPGNTECLDLCNIDHIFGYKWARKRTEFPQLLVFRFLARLITEGAAPNEVHVFGLDTLSQMEAALHLLSEAVENAKYVTFTKD